MQSQSPINHPKGGGEDLIWWVKKAVGSSFLLDESDDSCSGLCSGRSKLLGRWLY